MGDSSTEQCFFPVHELEHNTKTLKIYLRMEIVPTFSPLLQEASTNVDKTRIASGDN